MDRAARASSSLTKREAQILDAMAGGLSCREIASVLSISEYTVRKHRSNMLAKLAVRNAPQLVAHARGQNWLTPVPDPTGTAREREVMTLVVDGLTSKAIARRLQISDLTVRKHRENLLRKLGLRSTAQLVALAHTATPGSRDD